MQMNGFSGLPVGHTQANQLKASHIKINKNRTLCKIFDKYLSPNYIYHHRKYSVPTRTTTTNIYVVAMVPNKCIRMILR